jgi:peptidoglycan/LPS O-acetylase OafA/YrhL
MRREPARVGRDVAAATTGPAEAAEHAGPAGGGRIDVIDGLRGLAILMVIFRHTFFDTFASPGFRMFFFADGIPFFPFTHLSNTWMGVNLFFLDSGFVLYLPFAAGRRAIRSLGDVRRLYVRRAWRLLPLYYVMLVACLVLDAAVLHRVKAPWFEIPAYLTFTFPFFPAIWQPRPNGALWSIGVEVWFSLAFPFLVLLVQRIGMARFVACAAAVALATRGLAYAHLAGVQSTKTLNTLADSLPGRIDNFALGMAAAALFTRGWRGIGPAVGAFAAFVLFTGSCWLWDSDLAFGQPTPWAGLGGYALANAAFFFLLLAALRSQGWLRRILRFAPLRAAGIGCYSLYLVHVPLVEMLSHGPKAALIPVYWALTALVSYGTYRLIEKPGMIRGREATR